MHIYYTTSGRTRDNFLRHATFGNLSNSQESVAVYNIYTANCRFSVKQKNTHITRIYMGQYYVHTLQVYVGWYCICYLFIKLCSINSSVFYMKIEFLNLCEGFTYFLGNRNRVPATCDLISRLVLIAQFMSAFGLRGYEISILFMSILRIKVSYSFKIGCALNLLI